MTNHTFVFNRKNKIPDIVRVRAGIEYLYAEGVDINELRLPLDAEALRLIQELITEVLKTERGGMVLPDDIDDQEE